MKTLLKLGFVALLVLAVAFVTGRAHAGTLLPDKTIPGKVVMAEDFVLNPGETMEGDLTVIGAEARLRPESRLNGNLSVLGGKAVVEHGALVNGNVSVTGGQVFINGHVLGNLSVFGGEVNLGKEARVDGKIRAFGGAVRRGAAVVPLAPADRLRASLPPYGPFGEENSYPERMVLHVFWKITLAIIWTIVLALLGGVAALFIPNVMSEVAGVAIKKWPASLAVGVAIAVLVPIVVVAFLLTIVLILAIPLLFLALWALALLGWVAIGLAIGERLGLNLSEPWRAAIGTGLLTFLASMADLVPCIGWVVPAGLTLWALGAATLWLYPRYGGELPLSVSSQVVDAS